MTQGHLRTSLQKFRRDQLTASCFGGRPQASRRRRGSYEQVCKGCCGGGGRDRGDAGVQTWSPRPPCYALYRSSPRSMRPGTPLNAADYEAGAEVCGHIVGIDARPLISRQHSSRAPVTAIKCRFQLHMSRPADDKSRPWNELFFFASRASR